MTYKELDPIVLTRDLREHGLKAGDLGAVVIASSGSGTLDVEFVRASGQTQAVVTLPIESVRPVQDEDLIAVRRVPPNTHGAT
jgi:hypothetical protein